MPMVVHDIIISFANGVKKILGDDLKKIILYGSYARGDYSENSDIDIMVLTTLTAAKSNGWSRKSMILLLTF